MFNLNRLLAQKENSRLCQIMPEFARFSRKIPDFSTGMAKSRKCRHFPNPAHWGGAYFGIMPKNLPSQHKPAWYPARTQMFFHMFVRSSQTFTAVKRDYSHSSRVTARRRRRRVVSYDRLVLQQGVIYNPVKMWANAYSEWTHLEYLTCEVNS